MPYPMRRTDLRIAGQCYLEATALLLDVLILRMIVERFGKRALDWRTAEQALALAAFDIKMAAVLQAGAHDAAGRVVQTASVAQEQAMAQPAIPVVIMDGGTAVAVGQTTPRNMVGSGPVFDGPATPIQIVTGRPAGGPATPMMVVTGRPVLVGPALPVAQ
jgi:hypothetical protein